MNPKRILPRKQAFTLIELLVVVAIIAIMVAMLGHPHRGAIKNSQLIQCISNLKQIGLGLIMYSEDNNNYFPWQVLTNAGDKTEIRENPEAADHIRHLTNIVKQPYMFVCPADKTRTRTATNFVRFSNTNLSYFVSVSATAFLRTNQSLLILAGDRHLSLNNLPAKPGLCIVETYSAPGWTQEMHYSRDEGPRGNLLFADGHVASFSSSRLPAVFKDQPINPSRLAIP